MSIEKTIILGLSANEFSKQITGTTKVSPERTAIATGTGAALGAATVGTFTVGASAIGLTTIAAATAPITVPLAAGAALIAGIASLFD